MKKEEIASIISTKMIKRRSQRKNKREKEALIFRMLSCIGISKIWNLILGYKNKIQMKRLNNNKKVSSNKIVSSNLISNSLLSNKLARNNQIQT